MLWLPYIRTLTRLAARVYCAKILKSVLFGAGLKLKTVGLMICRMTLGAVMMTKEKATTTRVIVIFL